MVWDNEPQEEMSMNLGMDEQREQIVVEGPSNAQMIKRAAWITGAVFGVAFIGMIIWINLSLPSRELAYDTREAPTLFAYKLTQTPAKPIAGRPITFTFTVLKDGQLVKNREVVVAVSHATGRGINDRASDSLIKQVTTDEKGRVTVTHKLGFWSLGADKGFGVAVAPVLTEAENIAIDRISLTGVYGDDLNTGLGYDIAAVYPRWMGWLLWR
jgi:hypothetical protein